MTSGICTRGSLTSWIENWRARSASLKTSSMNLVAGSAALPKTFRNVGPTQSRAEISQPERPLRDVVGPWQNPALDDRNDCRRKKHRRLQDPIAPADSDRVLHVGFLPPSLPASGPRRATQVSGISISVHSLVSRPVGTRVLRPRLSLGETGKRRERAGKAGSTMRLGDASTALARGDLWQGQAESIDQPASPGLRQHR